MEYKMLSRERLGIEPSSAVLLQTTALKAAESTSHSIIPKIYFFFSLPTALNLFFLALRPIQYPVINT